MKKQSKNILLLLFFFTLFLLGVILSNTAKEPTVDPTVSESMSSTNIRETSASKESITENFTTETSVTTPAYTILENHSNIILEDVDGTLNMRMMIHREDQDLVAYYVTKSNPKEQRLTGTFNDSSNTFSLSNADHSIFLEGIEKANTPDGDLVVGTYSFDNATTTQNFTMAHAYTLGESETRTELYEYLGFSTTEIERFQESFLQYLSLDNKEALSKMISYPLTIHENNDTTLVLQNEKDFKQSYETIFTPDFKSYLLNDYAKYPWANYMGIALADGAVWYYPNSDPAIGTKIIAININR